MRASELRLDDLPYLTPQDAVEEALNMMDECKVTHLAVVEQRNLVGIAHEHFLMDHLDKVEVNSMYDPIKDQFVYDTTHLFEVVQKMNEHKLSVIPVLSEKDNWFLGSISLQQLMEVISEMPVVKSPGGIVILEMQTRDYHLGQIAQIVENNQSLLLGAFVTRSPDPSVIELTLKLNKPDISGVVQALERFNYKIVGTYDQGDYGEYLRDRYDSLMNYLNI
jgi:acetoin utilization protein AcuB